MCALRLHFFEQSFRAIGQKKNEAILLARSDVTVEKKVEMQSAFFQAQATFLWRNLFSKQEGFNQKVQSQLAQVENDLNRLYKIKIYVNRIYLDLERHDPD